MSSHCLQKVRCLYILKFYEKIFEYKIHFATARMHRVLRRCYEATKLRQLAFVATTWATRSGTTLVSTKSLRIERPTRVFAWLLLFKKCWKKWLILTWKQVNFMIYHTLCFSCLEVLRIDKFELCMDYVFFKTVFVSY